MSTYLQQFVERFTSLDGANLDPLEKLYCEDVTFRDPLHHIQGLHALLYEHLPLMGGAIRWLKGRLA
ncbi:hypothetical protein ACF8LH_20825 [Pseudomonas sp. zbq_4]|uniref:hypothetical protein n=1 Tax=Pseudomonas sp. zbq_4 TaxID=3367240 RepID=UPI00370C88F9